mmetsp:Transcript_99190/g.286215  ORF Transcript_99190/g.286215 Transcript_99190/m.286215 type:complete len:246 (+) Transcript_99190:674-1411(+)
MSRRAARTFRRPRLRSSRRQCRKRLWRLAHRLHRRGTRRQRRRRLRPARRPLRRGTRRSRSQPSPQRPSGPCRRIVLPSWPRSRRSRREQRNRPPNTARRALPRRALPRRALALRRLQRGPAPRQNRRSRRLRRRWKQRALSPIRHRRRRARPLQRRSHARRRHPRPTASSRLGSSTATAPFAAPAWLPRARAPSSSRPRQTAWKPWSRGWTASSKARRLPAPQQRRSTGRRQRTSQTCPRMTLR